ncbi:HEAT repeat domain-containing protein [Psychrobacter sp. I-STPA10]|uniref:HEAT repeat domain-containing protein n=1 Tax=Psychrobacter sp. I-STPA10 TaxID=2585769 RepID=UPI001E2A6852|nr:HEAT repeat domain-containing protein [Psychrobacter sp. I-STPA10]
MKNSTLPYWGQINALVSQDNISIFTTRQPNYTDSNKQTSPMLYRIDSSKEPLTLQTTAMPCAIQAMCALADSTIMMVGQDGHLYQSDWQAKKIKQVSDTSAFDKLAEFADFVDTNNNDNNHKKHNPNAVAMATLEGAIAVLYPRHIVVWQYQKHQVGDCLAVLPLSQQLQSDNTSENATDSTANITNTGTGVATTFATSSDGKWLVVGNTLGQVSSYQWLGQSSAQGDDTNNTTATASFAFSSQAMLHDGKVNALCFEPVSQYFFSAGTDKKLLRTHVQGDLHPLDRAKASQHSEMVTALLVSDSRLYTGSDDKSIKSWAFDKGQPNSCKEDLSKIRQLSLVNYLGQSAIVAVGTDQSLRYVLITDSSAGKLGEVAHIIKDGYQQVQQLLTDTSAHADTAFNEALELLNGQVDKQNLTLVSNVLDKLTAKDSHKVEQLIAWIAQSGLDNGLDKAPSILEKQLNNAPSKRGRQIAFEALASLAYQQQQQADEAQTLDSYEYLDIALKSKHEDVVTLAVNGYFDVAKQSEDLQRLVLPILQEVLCQNQFANVRKQALVILETLLPEDSPKADLMALESNHSDIKQAGLIRLYQRGMLDSIEVRRQLMLLQNNEAQMVRQTAFYVSVLAEPKLTEALKHASQQLGDNQLQRILQDFNDFRLWSDTLISSANEPSQKQSALQKLSQTLKTVANKVTGKDTNQKDDKNNASSNNSSSNSNTANTTVALDFTTQDFANVDNVNHTNNSIDKTPPIQTANLSNAELEPLLQGLGNPHADICFHSAYALACLQDRRAFGSLIRLMHDQDNNIRAGVAVALANLGDIDGSAEGKDILPLLLDDKVDNVRQTAMNAYGKLADNPLQWASVGFASKHQDIHERALAIFLTQANTADSTTSNTLSEEMTAVLLQALNNPFESIRQEVVKVLLNWVINQTHNADNANTDNSVDNSPAPLVKLIDTLSHSQFKDVHQVAVAEWQHQLLQQQEKRGQTTAEQKQAQDEQNQQVLSLFLADKFNDIRRQAIDIALKQKHISIASVINSALASPFSDMRKLALHEVNKHASAKLTEQVLPTISTLFDDDSQELREKALDTALILCKTVSNQQYQNMLTSALSSPYAEIQLKSATLLAQQCQLQQLSSHVDIDNSDDIHHIVDEQNNIDKQNSSNANQTNQNSQANQAYAVFEQYLAKPMPTLKKDSEDYRQWQRHIEQSLEGLAVLCSFSADGFYQSNTHLDQQAQPKQQQPQQKHWHAFDWFVHYLDHADADFRTLAPQLMWVARPNTLPAHRDKLIDWQNDERNIVKQSASIALAVWGDNNGEQLFTKDKRGLKAIKYPLTELHWLQARNGLGIANANILADAMNDNGSYEKLNEASRLLLVFYDLLSMYSKDNEQSQPKRLISSLSFASDKSAVFIANVLARFEQNSQKDSQHDSNNTTSTNTPSIQPRIWQYLSDYLQQQLKHIFNGYINNKEQQELLTIITAERLYQLAQQIIFANPLRKAHAIEVLYRLSELLGLPEYSRSSIVVKEMAHAWQRGYVALTDNLNNSLNDDNSDSVHVGVNIDVNADDTTHYPYQSLAFGAWLDIIRQDSYQTHYANTAIHGLMWLTKQPQQNQAHSSADWQDSVRRVLLPLLNYRHYDVRELAWQSLQQLNAPAQKLSEQAISSPHLDMIKKGLTLLVDNTDASTEQVNEQLTELLQSNSLQLADEVYKLLQQRVGNLPASLSALTAYNVLLRQQVVTQWQSVQAVNTSSSTSTDNKDKATDDKLTLLQTAMHNDDLQTRYLALCQLADNYISQQPTEILTALFKLWRNMPERYSQKNILDKIYTALDFLQNKQDKAQTQADTKQAEQGEYTAIYQRFSQQLLTLIDAPENKGEVDSIYQTIGKLRDVSLVPALLKQLQDSYQNSGHSGRKMSKHARNQLIQCIVTISGFDQTIMDYEDLQSTEHWQEKQHTRYPEVLLDLFNHLLAVADYDKVYELLSSMAWAGKEIDKDKPQNINQQIDLALQRAYEQIPDSKPQYRRRLIETMVFRADKRQGSLTSLRKALQSREPEIQFLSAEGLAKQGSFEGLSILMATIDYNTDGELRRRGVLALGELLGNAYDNVHKQELRNTEKQTTQNAQYIHAIEQAYDKLIKLAQDNEHYLKDVASEALGRLSQDGQFEHSDTIFALLKTQLHNLEVWDSALIHCLNGLRWLNTTPAWEEIRQYIRRYLQTECFFAPQDHAVTLLRHASKPIDIEANKTLLLDIIKQSGEQDSELDDDTVIIAFKTAQALWKEKGTEKDNENGNKEGNETENEQQQNNVYPYDWAMLLSCDPLCEDETIGEQLSLKRICQHASIDELTDFINRYQRRLDSTIKQRLADSILARQDMPVSSLQQLISSDTITSKHIGLRYLNQYPNSYLNADNTNIVELLWQQFELAKNQWAGLCKEVSQRPALTQNGSWLERSEQIADTIKQLLWLLIRHTDSTDNTTKQRLNELWTWLIDNQNNPVLSAVKSLATWVDGWWNQALLAQLASLSSTKANTANIAEPLEQLLQTYHASQGIAWLNNDTQQLLGQIQQVISLQQAGKVDKTDNTVPANKDNATPTDSFVEKSPNQQLLAWIKADDAESLMNWAFDNSLTINLRLRAIESLSQLHDPRIEQWLQTLIDSHQTDSADNVDNTDNTDSVSQEIAKTAYKVLRRWQRAISRQQQKRALPQSQLLTQAQPLTDTPANATSGKGE